MYHYAGNNPINYTDPDGNDVKGVLRGIFHTTLAVLTVASGIAIMAGAAGGEVGSGGTLTVPMAIAAVAGFDLTVAGFAAVACSLAETSVELAGCFTDKVPDGDYLPSGIGGCIGMEIDMQNGFDAQKAKAKGPSQVKGEAVETLINTTISTASAGKAVKDAASLSNISKAQAKKIIQNEVSHQYDMYCAAQAIGDLSKPVEDK